MFKFKFNYGTELQREKQKDYRNVVLNQIIIIVFGLTLTDLLLEGSETPGAKFATSIFFFFGALYSFLMWDMLKNFTENRLLINITLIILSGIIISGMLTEFPYYKVLHVPDRRIFFLIIHILLFSIEVVVISFAMRDIFSGEFLTPDKLWGSACIFLMIGISFGSFYDLICMIRPGSLGADLELGWRQYSECVTYSLSILGGIDPEFGNASKLIKNISVLEAVWSNLFVVLIIGKLMGLPRPPKIDYK
ncbi:MAG: hypothetical protein JNM57_02125 [Cyclobacteriaceae bacterium]|nr:hypothetical protein [Cyclobacteriaceae bacterium]